ncbi:hypothetical protein OUZ56_007660 [Daphnia magna]|uniref:Uncharacterized protein n=1 Tax=Daphnia magna TaxID=35525 RepID=A0ABR0AAY6_9CRUS|nr:hypothetical protein OUZ56_007660 [Daphnia magna]
MRIAKEKQSWLIVMVDGHRWLEKLGRNAKLQESASEKKSFSHYPYPILPCLTTSQCAVQQMPTDMTTPLETVLVAISLGFEFLVSRCISYHLPSRTRCE